MQQTIDTITEKEAEKLVEVRHGFILITKTNNYLVANRKMYKRKGNKYYEIKIKQTLYWM